MTGVAVPDPYSIWRGKRSDRCAFMTKVRKVQHCRRYMVHLGVVTVQLYRTSGPRPRWGRFLHNDRNRGLDFEADGKA